MKIRLKLLGDRFAVCRFAAQDTFGVVQTLLSVPPEVPPRFLSVTRTSDELSVVCSEEAVPHSIQSERGWRCLAVAGPIPFEVTGVAAAIAAPLAQAGISIFLVSTFDTDYLLVKEDALKAAIAALRDSGCDVEDA